METKTRELPLMSAADAPTSQIPHLPEPTDDRTRRIDSAQSPVAPAGPPVPPPFSASPAEAQTVPIGPQSAPPSLPPVATPPPFMPLAAQGHIPATQALPPAAAPAARRPLRWPVAIASWLGGVVVGMLVLTLALGAFGGPREVTASNGDPAAEWDTSITLTDAALTTQARKSGNAQVQEPTMRVKADGTIAMEGTANLFGRSVPVNGTLQPTLADGKLKMEVVSMQLGGLPLPEFLVTQLQNSVAGAAQPPAAAANTEIVKIEASEGKLVIYSKMQ
jgi:hypothetical protein